MSSRSSRSPAVLSRSRSRSRSQSVARPRGVYSDRALWGYLVAAVVVLIVVLVVVGDRYLDVHAWARIQHSFSLLLMLAFSVLLAAYATYLGHRSRTRMDGFVVSVGTLFVVIAVMLVMLAWVVYRSHNYTGGFYISLVALVLAVVHMWLVWRAHPVAGYAAVPLVFVLSLFTYLLWYMADESSDLLASTCVTYEGA